MIAGGARCFLCALLLAAGLSAPAAAQPADTAKAEPTPPIVRSVRFVGNEVFSDRVLARRVRTAPNRRFLGLPGFTWWRWIYSLGNSGLLGRRVGEALKRSGEAPAYLDSTLLADDVERLRLFYQQEGFRQAQVSARVEPSGSAQRVAEAERVRVVFQVAPGPPLYARRVRYDGLETLTAEQQRRLAEASLLSPARVDAETPLQFQAQDQRYSETLLLEERQRILQFLRSQGYAAATRDSVRALIFPQETPGAAADSFDITFRVRPGLRYRIGEIRFDVSGPEDAAAAPRLDTLADGPAGLITARIQNESRLSPELLDRALQLRPGMWYDESALRATKRRLEAAGVFSFTDITPLMSRVEATDSAGAPRLPHRITLRTRRRHRIRLETFMLQRSGVLASENELGTGVGVTYENVNLLGGGEAFRVRASGSLSADFDSTLFSSAQAEVSTSLTYPYLIGPFGRLERAFSLYDARTQLSLSLLTARRENLRFIIRGRGNARLRLEMRHTATLSSLVDVLDVSISNPDTLTGFLPILNQIIGSEDDPIVTDPVQRARIKEDYTQPQINTNIGYTFRAARVNPIRRERGYSYEAALEVGNTLPRLLDRFVLSPDTVESSLPGPPLLRGEVANRLLYRPYIRLVSDLRHYQPVSPEDVLALKLIAGFAHPTGRPDVVPFDRRFYSGGASSVRGWDLRELRPVPDTTGSVVPNILGGDVKLEASIELRNTFLQNTLGADWILALFTDAGNVWFGPRNPGAPEGRFRFGEFYEELGVGTGYGLRLAWDYLILRLDVAYKVHDPLQPESGLFPDGLNEPRLHFGIGHAF